MSMLALNYLHVLNASKRGLDFAPPKSVRTLGESTPIVVILHGLTGGTLFCHSSFKAKLTCVMS